jgi:hypothetical protein
MPNHPLPTPLQRISHDTHLAGNPLGSFGSRKLLNAMSDTALEDSEKGAQSQR